MMKVNKETRHAH